MLNDFATSRFENYISTVSWLRETAALYERMWRRLRTRTALLGWYHRVCSSLFSTVAAGRLHGLSIDLENNEIVLLCQVLQVEFFSPHFCQFRRFMAWFVHFCLCLMLTCCCVSVCTLSVLYIKCWRQRRSVSRWAMPQHCHNTTKSMKLPVHHSELLPANAFGNYWIFMQIYVDSLCFILRLITSECTHGGSLVQPPSGWLHTLSLL